MNCSKPKKHTTDQIDWEVPELVKPRLTHSATFQDLWKGRVQAIQLLFVACLIVQQELLQVVSMNKAA
jgi:hypothetical protein